MKVKAFLTRHKKAAIAAAVLLVLVLLLSARAGGGAASQLVEETPAIRSIHTYKSFSGNVEPASDTGVYAKVSQQVKEVRVSEGDAVKAGDVIAVLDDTAVRQNIAKAEVSLSSSQTSRAYSVSDAQRNYDNYKETLDQGLNTALNSAETALDTAEEALSAAKADRDAALQSIDSGTYAETQALYDARAAAQAAYDAAKTAYDALPEDDPDKAAAGERLTQAEAQLSAAQEAFTAARKAVETAKQSAVDAAQENRNSARRTYDAASLSAQQQLEAYEAALDKAKGTNSTASTELELRQLRESLANYTLYAPCDGTITALNVSEGAMVSGGSSVATISTLSAMKVAINVDEYAILDTGEGSAVTIIVDSIDRTYTGTISYVADVAKVSNGVSYYAAEVLFEADEYVRSGMSVEVRLTTTDKPDVLTVSADALHYRTDGSPYVLVKTGKTQEERDVETGVTDGSYVEILSGLTAEDTVLTSPTGEVPGGVLQRVRDSRDS